MQVLATQLLPRRRRQRLSLHRTRSWRWKHNVMGPLQACLTSVSPCLCIEARTMDLVSRKKGSKGSSYPSDCYDRYCIGISIVILLRALIISSTHINTFAESSCVGIPYPPAPSATRKLSPSHVHQQHSSALSQSALLCASPMAAFQALVTIKSPSSCVRLEGKERSFPAMTFPHFF